MADPNVRGPGPGGADDGADDRADDEPDGPDRFLGGRMLRYVLTDTLCTRGPCTVAELTAAVGATGRVLSGRPSKVVSDALRWEIAHGRVVRLGRGRYGPGRMPRQTRAWIRDRVRAIQSEPS